jgi:hypothetical protein
VSAINLAIVVLLSAGMMALAITLVGILRRALQTGVLKKGSMYFMGGNWSRAKNPVVFRFMWSIGAFGALGLFILGALFSIGSVAIFFGHLK